MNHGPAAASELAVLLGKLADTLSKTELMVAPATISVGHAVKAAEGTKLQIGTQNIHWEQSGAFTGEISPPMVSEIGATFSLIGHSERRTLFGENDSDVAKRCEAAISANIKPIVCIGETLDEREQGKTLSVLQKQLSKIVGSGTEDIIIAYEPVWAIGTGKSATAEEIEQTHSEISSHWKEQSGKDCPPILYGGSVSPENYNDIITLPSVSGALVGGASLSYKKFSQLAEISEA